MELVPGDFAQSGYLASFKSSQGRANFHPPDIEANASGWADRPFVERWSSWIWKRLSRASRRQLYSCASNIKPGCWASKVWLSVASAFRLAVAGPIP